MSPTLREAPSGSDAFPPRPRPTNRDSSSLITRALASSGDDEVATTSQTNNGPSANGSENASLLIPRRSSIAERIGSISHYGGPNSLSNFASSWQRAAGFYEITRQSSGEQLEQSDQAEEVTETEAGDPEQGPSRGSLLRSVLSHDRRKQSDHAITDDTDELGTSPAPPDVNSRIAEHRRRSSMVSRMHQDGSIFYQQPQLGSTPQIGSYGSTYGSLASRLSEPAQRHAGRLFSHQQSTGTSVPDKEREPLLTKPVRQSEGGTVNIVVGQSTLPQTIFNSVNTLIGVVSGPIRRLRRRARSRTNILRLGNAELAPGNQIWRLADWHGLLCHVRFGDILHC